MCRYESAYVIDDINGVKKSGMCVRTQPARRYLLIEYCGKVSEIQQLYLWILSDYLTNTQLIVTYQYVIERYIKVDYNNDIFHLDILIKVH
ncbi:GyrI-like domain-containing protein [Psychromonas hadalis]|uniref:GyrI-like domain-containing protein n=1 Tax=Psychromonas hadalis TaxID=211669 RepID=UPI0003F4D04E|nr:GyrI-like domain-containing protein [Psychromonas hadalis]